MPDLSRRKLIGSLISLVAAPAIVRVSSIMPVKAILPLRYFCTTDIEPVIFNSLLFWVSGPHTMTWGADAVVQSFINGRWEIKHG